MSDKRKGIDSLASNVERRIKNKQLEVKTVARRTQDYLDNRVKDEEYLDSKYFARKTKDKRREEEAGLRSHKLYVWGFGEDEKR